MTITESPTDLDTQAGASITLEPDATNVETSSRRTTGPHEEPHPRPHRSRAVISWLLVAGAVVAAVVLAIAVFGDDESNSPAVLGDAKDNPNFGQATPQSDLVEDFARANGMSGLSPASMTAAVATESAGDAKDNPNFGQATQQNDVGVVSDYPWAADGLAGLSPASIAAAVATETVGDAKDNPNFGQATPQSDVGLVEDYPWADNISDATETSDGATEPADNGAATVFRS